MQKSRFQNWFNDLHAHYPGFQMPSPKLVMDIYFKELGRYPEETLNGCVGGLLSASPQFFPTAGLIKQQCEALIDATRAQGKKPRVRYWPHDHGCQVNGSKLKLAGPRKFLYAINAYEAAHVLCACDKSPRCPWCGRDSISFINPMIKKLMEDFPLTTKGWNPAHKGNSLCVDCERRDYPQGFVN